MKYKDIIKNRKLLGFICNCGGSDGDHDSDCPVKNWRKKNERRIN